MMDTIFKWHSLPLSVKREIATRYGAAPQGTMNEHHWTLLVIEAVSERDQIEQFIADISTAAEMQHS